MSDKKVTAHSLPPRRIQEVASELHLDTELILPHGHYIAKIPIAELEARENSRTASSFSLRASRPHRKAKARPPPVSASRTRFVASAKNP